MRKFDYSFLNNGLLPANLVNLTSNIAALKTMAGVRKDEYPQIFTELEAVAKVQSIKSSNAIEGIVTSDERIAAIVNQNSAPLNHNEAEIAGYRDALNEIHFGYEHIDFRQSDILRLHEMMMSFAGYEYGGQYKTDDNVILEIDADGNRRVRFRPTPASETPKAMEQLELAYLDARSDANINQLLLIPCVILDFLCIHPFRDGNGRMSRLLSLLLLYKMALMPVNMCPLRSRSTTTRRIIMKPCGSPRQDGKRMKTPISPLSRISSTCFICAIRNWTSGLRWYMAGRSRRRPVWRRPS